MSRPRRLPALRLARIGGWTAAATAGVAVAMTRFSGPAEVPAAPAVEPAPATAVTVTTTTGAALPAAPPGGLLVLHLSPAPGVPVAAVTTVTTVPLAAPSVPVAQPTTTTTATTVTTVPPVTSSGS